MNISECNIKCCGCTACMTVCPTKAINFAVDEKGFEVPSVDNEKCVQCEKCLTVCAFYQHETAEKKYPIATYACKLKDETKRMISRSGGAWIALAEYVISLGGGIVYGAIMLENGTVAHSRCSDMAALSKTQGSKYVQSSLVINKVYESVINDLKAGLVVLFSGVGCQVGGLLKMLKEKHIDCSKLITVDIVCHGVISPKILSDYISWLNKHHKGNIKNFDFRDKSLGWNTASESYVINDKKYIRGNYTELFYSRLCKREGCFECPYTSIERCGDFTLADCWTDPKNTELNDFNDNKGLSLLFVNTERANKIWQDCADEFKVREVNIKKYTQPQLKHPIKKNVKYDLFWEKYRKRGFKYILNKYGKNGLKFKVKHTIKKILTRNV